MEKILEINGLKWSFTSTRTVSDFKEISFDCVNYTELFLIGNIMKKGHKKYLLYVDFAMPLTSDYSSIVEVHNTYRSARNKVINLFLEYTCNRRYIIYI